MFFIEIRGSVSYTIIKDFFAVTINKVQKNTRETLLARHRTEILNLFILSLVKTHCLIQFFKFAWTHSTLQITVLQTYPTIQILFESMIWFLLLILGIACKNDTTYIFLFSFFLFISIKSHPMDLGRVYWSFIFYCCMYIFPVCYFPYILAPVLSL